MMNDENYLRTLDPKILAELVKFNASPKLLGLTIKVNRILKLIQV